MGGRRRKAKKGEFGGRKKPTLTKHQAIRDRKFGRRPPKADSVLCPLCAAGRHTRNEHRFHGKGSFCRTHPKARKQGLCKL